MKNENYKNTIDVRQQKEKEALIKSLSEMPIIEIACKRAGVGRASYYRWLKEDSEFLKKSRQCVTRRQRINK